MFFLIYIKKVYCAILLIKKAYYNILKLGVINMISDKVIKLIQAHELKLYDIFKKIDKVTEYNEQKVLKAMQDARLNSMQFESSTGYGYHDVGRDAVEEIYANIFKSESALVRPQLVSGTHALTCALFGNLRPGDILFSPVGKPYDTLESVIGINKTSGSLAEYGIIYKQADLTQGGDFDYEKIAEYLKQDIKLITIQRSKGYTWRDSFTIDKISYLISFIRKINKHAIIMVDNCYGEFVETTEPIEIGADLVVGSLIKNPGGGLAPMGGYIVGKSQYVQKAADRLTAPGLGMELGSSMNLTRTILHGVFIAPTTVAGAVKGAILVASVFESLGYKVLPTPFEQRTDIVQAIHLGTPEKVKAFCQAIQKASPVDSFVTPEPAPMPGYDKHVIMAGGTFIQGSSIELSADAPICEPYNVFFQGGLTYSHAKIGVMFAVEKFI